MSYQGQTWVDEVAFPHLNSTGELVMLLRVANHAGNGPKKMSGCFARSKVLAKECIMSPRTAQTHLRELAKRGLLIPGDPKLVEHIRPDIRPPVWDLAGAHEAGCPGGHDIDGECLPAAAGSKICHPSPPKEKPRSAGSKDCHPSAGEAGTGSKKRQPRVAKIATIKSSKELKESLSPGASPSSSAPGASAGLGGEREAAEPKTNNSTDSPAGVGVSDDVAKVMDAYFAAYMSAHNMPPSPSETRSVHAGAVTLLAAGRSVGNLCDLVAALPAKGWTNLEQHARRNPEKTAPPAAVGKPWCGECNYGQEPTFAAGRMREGENGRMEKCHCHPGYVPQQPVHA